MCIKFQGGLFKEGRYWSVEVPALDIVTQGKSKQDGYAMIKEAIELHVDRSGFKVEIVPSAGERFVVKAQGTANDKYLIALLLKQQRAKHGLSTAEVARRLGITKHAYAQYEQARSLPSLTKVEEFIHAMSKRAHFVLTVFEENDAA